MKCFFIYLEKYNNASGNDNKDKVNSMRREKYADIKDERNARRRELYKENKTSKLDKRLDFILHGEKMFIPKGTEITNVKTIAGKGSKVILRKAKDLAEKYGGNAEDWQKKVGKIESDKYIFDVHWYEGVDKKQYHAKIKSGKERNK